MKFDKDGVSIYLEFSENGLKDKDALIYKICQISFRDLIKIFDDQKWIFHFEKRMGLVDLKYLVKKIIDLNR